MRVALDSNVLISALIFGGSPRRLIFDLISLQKMGKIRIILCLEVMEEVEEVVRRKFPHKVEELRMFWDLLDPEVVRADYDSGIHIEIRDKKDEVIVRCAASYSDFLITGDKDILDCKHNTNLKIMTVSEFIDFLGIFFL